MPKTSLNFIAHIRTKPGREDVVRAALEAMVIPTRAEVGCVNYDLHRSRDDAAVFVLYEGWISQDALDAHMRTPHFHTLGAALGEHAVAAPDGKPFVGEALAMMTEPVPLKL